jgi:hypothetical protein
MEKTKKPWHPPTITEHGGAVKNTKGLGGRFWETYAPKPLSSSDIEDLD